MIKTTAIINKKCIDFRLNEVLCKQNKHICEFIGIRSVPSTVIKRANLHFTRMHCAEKSLINRTSLKNSHRAGIHLFGDFAPSLLSYFLLMFASQYNVVRYTSAMFFITVNFKSC